MFHYITKMNKLIKKDTGRQCMPHEQNFVQIFVTIPVKQCKSSKKKLLWKKLKIRCVSHFLFRVACCTQEKVSQIKEGDKKSSWPKKTCSSICANNIPTILTTFTIWLYQRVKNSPIKTVFGQYLQLRIYIYNVKIKSNKI